MLTDIDQQRQGSETGCSVSRFVDCDEFCRLLLGFKKLERADKPARGLRGLYDAEADTLYLIQQDRLASFRSDEGLSESTSH